LDADQIREAREICSTEFGNQIPFHVADASTPAARDAYDAILFVDFLEHVPYPARIVAVMDRCLKPAGVMVISVPTPRYPHVFGREMQERIGHLVDGYTADTLTDLLPSKYSRIETRYSTGPIGSLLCAIQCRLLERIPVALRWLCALPLLALRGLDVISPSKFCKAARGLSKTRTGRSKHADSCELLIIGGRRPFRYTP
jgi:SAM-dependent methyltransferase